MFTVKEINTTKGRGCIATERIPAGTLIIKASPSAFVIKSAFRRQICHKCLRSASSLNKESFQHCARCKVSCYCSRTCQAADWRSGHQEECARLVALAPKVPTETVFLASRILTLRETAPSTFAEIEKLSCAQKRDGDLDSAQRYMAMSVMTADFLGHERLHTLVGSGELLVGLLSKLETNAFNICNGDLQPIGIGVYPSASFFNHSCQPNACTVFEGTTLCISAIRDIAPGEEIVISYIDLGASLEHRRTELRKGFGFTCTCERCVAEDKEKKSTKRSGVVELNEQAEECRGKGDITKARRLWEEVCSALSSSPEDVEMLPALNGLVGCCVAQEDWTGAAKYCARSIPLYEKYYGINWPVTGLQYYMMGKLEWRLENAEAAYMWLRKATLNLSLSHNFSGNTVLRELHELVHQVEVEISFRPTSTKKQIKSK